MRIWDVDSAVYQEMINHDAGGRIVKERLVFDDYTTPAAPDSEVDIGSDAAPWTYDGAGRLYAIPGLIASTSYNGRDEPTQLARANGVATAYTYQPSRDWLTGLQTAKGAATLQSLAVTRDARGRIATATSDAAAEGWSYGYDEFDRLTQATNTGNAGLSQSFAYDPVDNVTSNSAVGSYSYPPPGAARPDAVTQAGSTSSSYTASDERNSRPTLM